MINYLKSKKIFTEVHQTEIDQRISKKIDSSFEFALNAKNQKSNRWYKKS